MFVCGNKDKQKRWTEEQSRNSTECYHEGKQAGGPAAGFAEVQMLAMVKAIIVSSWLNVETRRMVCRSLGNTGGKWHPGAGRKERKCPGVNGGKMP